MKSCKYIFAAVAALLGLQGCMHDKYAECPIESGGDKTGVAFTVTVPASMPDSRTRAGGKLYGDEIYCLDVLLVEADTGQLAAWESVPNEKIGGMDSAYKTFKVNFDIPTGTSVSYKLVVLANSYSILTQRVFPYMDLNDRSWIAGHHENWVYDQLYFSANPDNNAIFGMTGCPMWGETEFPFTLPVATVPTIQLLRPYARIDLNVEMSIQDVFAMTEYYIPYAYEYVRIVPEPGSYSHSERKVKCASICHDNSMWNMSEQIGPTNYGAIAVAEYSNSNWTQPEFVILIKGRYGPAGEEGWYKVRMPEGDILRNHQYVVTIIDVAGPGYPTEKEAMESQVYLLADIAEWNEAAQDVVIEGDHYLRISRTSFSIAKEDYMSKPITIETNYPGAGDKSGIGLNFAEGLSYRTLNPDWLITIVTPATDTPYKMTPQIVALENKTGATRHGAITFTAGNMTQIINVTQSAETWLKVEPEVVVALDGLYHKIDVSSDAEWTVSISGTGLSKYIPVTTSSAENRNAVYFRTAESGEYTYPYTVKLTFSSPEYFPSIAPSTTVTMCNLRGEANSYIVKPSGSAVAFPVSIANKTTLGRQQILDGEEVSYKIIWSDSQGVSATSNIQNIRVIGKGPGAYIYVTTGSKQGNAVIAATTKRRPSETSIPEEDVVRWSWHIWVTDYDPDVSSQTFISKQSIRVTTMDRLLGALRSDPGSPETTADWKLMRGLYYQWGRKDAFPLDIPVYDAAGSTGIGTSTDIGLDQEKSIMYPLRPSRNINWNGFDGHNTWGTYGIKTVHDPCPEGWKIPFYDYWGRSNMDTNAQQSGQNNLTGMGAKSYNVSGDPDSWWMYWFGYGGYFPGQGARSNVTSTFENITNKGWGYQWCGIGQSQPGGKFSFSFSQSAGNNSGVALAHGGQNIRCVKE